MKKLLSIILLFVVLTLVATSVVNATTNSELPEKLYQLGSKYGMTSSDKIRIQRYLADYPVTDEEANQVMAKAEEVVKIMEEAGVIDVSKLSTAQKNRIKTLANEAASIVGVTLKFKTGSVEIYKNGKLIDTIVKRNGELAHTDNKDGNVVLIVSSVAALALGVGLVARKRFANA